MASETSGFSTGTRYILYHNTYSICSIMMRYLMRIRGEPVDEASRMLVEEKLIDIFNEEQLAEDYLLKVNRNGQVPVLGSPDAFTFPMAQTTNITSYVAGRHPRLLPPEHANKIKKALEDMHDLNFFTLSFRSSPKLAAGFADGVLRRLERKDIGDEYRKALEYKLMILRRDKVNALEPENIAEQVKNATAFLQEMATLLPKDGDKSAGPWLFGQAHPTALDSNLVVMIARLQDVDRGDIIPEALHKYGDKAMSTPEWVEVMEGRRTMYDGSGLKGKK